MTTKNIANIQNNKLDFYVNGTNRFDVTLKGNRAFSISEDTNVSDSFQIRSAFSGAEQVSGADFVGEISNIGNHSIGNLSDVNIGSISHNQILQWDVAENLFKAVDANTSGATSFLISASTSVGETALEIDLGLIDDRLNFVGTPYEIDVLYDIDTTNLTFSLPTYAVLQALVIEDTTISNIDVSSISVFNLTVNGTPSFTSATFSGYIDTQGLIVDGTSTFTDATFSGMVEATHLLVDGTSRLVGDVIIDGDLTVNGTYTIINSEVKLIEDSIITLGYEEGGGATSYDIGFRGKYLETSEATNSALFFYDISATNFVLMNEYTLDDGTQPNDTIDLTAGEYATLVAGGIRLNKSSSRALADVSMYNLSYSDTFTVTASTTIAATNIIDCSNITNSTAVLSGILNITAWQDDLSSWAQNISNYSIIYKGSGDITVNFMTVFELNNNFEDFDLSTSVLTVRETNTGTYNVEARLLPLGHQIIAS